MQSPHAVEIPFVFNNISMSDRSSKPHRCAPAGREGERGLGGVRAQGDPNTTHLPKWPAYSAEARDTMLFNNDSRVVQDPERGPRLAMERALKLS